MTRVTHTGLTRGPVTLGGGAALLPFSDDFNRADGDVGNGWDYAAGIWTISSGSVSSNPDVGAELLPNGNCETGSPPTGYTALLGSVLSAAADERTGGSGTQSLQVQRGTANQSVRYIQAVTTGRYYRIADWRKAVTTTAISTQLGMSFWGDLAAQIPDWTYRRGVGLAFSTSLNTSYDVHGASGVLGRFDDFSVRALTTNNLFMTRDFGTSNVRVSVDTTVTDYAPCGIVLCLDDQTTPNNYILALVIPYKSFSASNEPKLSMYKVVNGVPSAIAINQPFIYAAGGTLGAELAGTALRIFWNGVQVGSDYSVSDASIINNTRHGLFDGGGSALGDFAIE